MFYRTILSLVLLLAPLSAIAQAVTVSDGEASAPTTDLAINALRTVLEDPVARAALIAQLDAAEDATADAPETEATVAERLASTASELVEDTTRNAEQLGASLTDLSGLSEALTLEGVPQDILLSLILTIAATLATYAILRRATDWLVTRRCVTAALSVAEKLRWIAAAAALRVLSVLCAAGVGYILAAYLLAPVGAVTTPQSLYLVSFLVFGLYRAALATVFSPDEDQRPGLSRLAPRAQAVLYETLRMLGGLVTLSALFIIPLVEDWVGRAAGASIRTTLATVTLLWALFSIYEGVRVLRLSRGHRLLVQGQTQTGRALAHVVARAWSVVWPLLAAVYVIVAWSVAVLRPDQFRETVLGGSLYTLAAIGLVMLAARFVETAADRHSALFQKITDAFPHAGRRISGIVTAFAWAAAMLFLLSSGVLLAHGWQFFDAAAWLDRADVQQALWGGASALLILFGAAAVWVTVAGWVDFELNARLTGDNASARKRTLLALFRNAFTVALVIMTGMIVLSQIGVNIGPLLAGAGVLGLAIGFGSQKLVQDVITGAFIQIENAVNEGDVVTLAGITGAVERISIRSVQLRGLDGTAHVIPFSSVDVVSNLTRDFAFHLAEIGVAYKEDVDDVKAAMHEAFDRLKEKAGPIILEPLEMHGVTALGDSAVTVQARIKTVPGEQWQIGRDYTELVKRVMEERGLEIPYPHRQLVFPPEMPQAAQRLAAE